MLCLRGLLVVAGPPPHAFSTLGHTVIPKSFCYWKRRDVSQAQRLDGSKGVEGTDGGEEEEGPAAMVCVCARACVRAHTLLCACLRVPLYGWVQIVSMSLQANLTQGDLDESIVDF